MLPFSFMHNSPGRRSQRHMAGARPTHNRDEEGRPAMDRIQHPTPATITRPLSADGDSDPDMDEALRRAREPRKAVSR